jgi:hypothetical protein
LAAALLVGTPAGADEINALVLEQKAKLVETIINRSLREIVGRDGAEIERLAEARQLLDRGRRSLGSGSLAEAQSDLNAALDAAVKFSRRHGERRETDEQLRARLKSRMEGIRQFRTALDAITAEKGVAAAGVVDLERVETLTAEGRRLAEAGRLVEADVSARQAYDLLAGAVSRLRQNETLRRELVFATPADEYEYEAERYRAHELLLKMVVSDREPGPGIAVDIARFEAAAVALETQAREHAEAGDFGRAVDAQEAASGQLVRALREAGMFLPY